MNDSTITLQGYVGTEPVLRKPGGHSVANFRLACTPRRLNRSTGEWADAPTQWYSVSAWRQLGENVAGSLHQGDAVVVHGRLMARSYINKDGFEVNTFDVEAQFVGHDLNRGRSMVMKNPPSRQADERRPDPQDREAALAAAREDWGGAPLAPPPYDSGETGAETTPEVESPATTAA